MEDNEKVESFREQVEQRLETLEKIVADLQSEVEKVNPPKGDS